MRPDALDAVAGNTSGARADGPRRVLFIASRTPMPADGVVPPHGSGAHVAATRAGLERHFDVVSVLGEPGGNDAPVAPRVRRFVPARLRGLRRDLLLVANERRVVARALRALGGKAPDAVYERSEYLAFAGMKLARKLRVPYVLEVDGIVDNDARTQYRSLAEPLGRRLERLKMSRAAAIVVESPGMAAALERRGVDPAKLVVAPNALPDTRVRAAARPVRPERAAIGWIGHLMPWYVDAVALLVDIAPRVLAAVPQARFEVVAGGPGLTELTALVAARGLQDRFRLRGPVPYEQVPALLEEFDVGVVPALFDYQFPVKLVEMGGAGLPVVAPATSSVDGLLAGGLEYQPFVPGDADSLADALVRVAADPELRARLGQALHEAVRTRFTWTVVSDQLAAAVRSAYASPSSSS